jgi:cell division protein FtsL
MFPKLVITLVAAVAVAGAVLELRHSRLRLMHEMAQRHTELDRVRRETWDLQVRVADRTDPTAIRAATQRQQLVLEPRVVHDPTSDVAVARGPEREAGR